MDLFSDYFYTLLRVVIPHIMENDNNNANKIINTVYSICEYPISVLIKDGVHVHDDVYFYGIESVRFYNHNYVYDLNHGHIYYDYMALNEKMKYINAFYDIIDKLIDKYNLKMYPENLFNPLCSKSGFNNACFYAITSKYSYLFNKIVRFNFSIKLINCNKITIEEIDEILNYINIKNTDFEERIFISAPSEIRNPKLFIHMIDSYPSFKSFIMNFSDDFLENIARKERFESLQWLNEMGMFDNISTEIAVETMNNVTNNIEIMKWLVERFHIKYFHLKITDFRVISNAINNNEKNSILWLKNQFNITCEDITGVINPFVDLVTNLEMAIWLTDIFNITEENVIGLAIDVFCKAADYGELKYMKWWQSTFGISREDILDDHAAIIPRVIATGNIEMMEWLKVTFILTEEDLRTSDGIMLRTALENNHANMVQWLEAQIRFTKEDIIFGENYFLEIVIANQNLELLQWLISTYELTREDVIAYDNKLYLTAAENNHIKIINWLDKTYKCSMC